MNGEGDGIALVKWNDFDAALHARALLGQHKIAAGEIVARLGKQNRDLDREGEVAVEILVQAIEVAGRILQQQRRRPRLARIVASFRKRVLVGIALSMPMRSFQALATARQTRIERCAQAAEKIRQRIFEVAILAFAKAVPPIRTWLRKLLLFRI